MRFPVRSLPLWAALFALLAAGPNLLSDPAALYPIQGDSAKYDELGRGLARLLSEAPAAVGALGGHGWGEEQRAKYALDGWIFQHAPLYGWSLGVAYAVTGTHATAGRLVSLACFAAAAALVAALAQRAAGRIAAIVGVLVFVLFPPNLYYATAIMTEMPVAFLLLFLTWALDRTRDRGDRRALFLGGLAIAALLLAKTTFRYAAVPVLIVDLFLRARRDGWVRHVAWRSGGLVAGLAPLWLFLALARLPVDPLSDAGETALWLFRGNYVPDRGFETVGIGDALTPELAEARRVTGGTDTGAVYTAALRETIRRDPLGGAALVLSKAVWFWTIPAIKIDLPFWFGSLPPPLHLHAVLALLALTGAAVALARRSALLVLALLAAYVSLVHAASHLVSRYNIPALAATAPLGATAAMLFVGAARDAVRRRADRPGFVEFLRGNWFTSGGAVVLGGAAIAMSRDQWVALLSISPVSAGRLQAVLGAIALLAAGIGLIRWLQARGTRGPMAATVSLLLVTPLASGVLALRWNEVDPDRFAARLERPGDRVVQTFVIPRLDETLAVVDSAEIVLDLLASPEPGVELAVSVRGVEVTRLGPRLPSGPERFVLDPMVFGALGRHERVLRTVQRSLDGFVRPRYPDAGFEYFRQWYGVPVPLSLLSGDEPIEVALEVVRAPHGWIDLFGDAQIDRASEARIDQPAFFSNAFDLSNYRFELFAHDRIDADARLVRPVRVGTAAVASRFERAGRTLSDLSPERGAQHGEYRVRLRLRQVGGPVCPETDPRRVTWRRTPRPGERWLTPNELHSLAIARDEWFDGWRTY